MIEHVIAAPFARPVRGFATTRAGGVSIGPFASLNLGAGADALDAVAENRRRLSGLLPATPLWLRQVHGREVIYGAEWRPGVVADAVWTDRTGEVLAVLTADCLPVLLADVHGSCIAAVHAGWRGLAAGVLEAAVTALPVDSRRLRAWIGPRVGVAAYEVDASVHDAFPNQPECFRPGRPGHWLADLPAIASARLSAAGVVAVDDCGQCTASEPERFFSVRRDGARTGRQAALIWIGQNE